VAVLQKPAYKEVKARYLEGLDLAHKPCTLKITRQAKKFLNKSTKFRIRQLAVGLGELISLHLMNRRTVYLSYGATRMMDGWMCSVKTVLNLQKNGVCAIMETNFES
jgi:adenine-specific DNA methylase